MCWYHMGRQGGEIMGEYTEYGYLLDGVEYATADEAYETLDDSE